MIIKLFGREILSVGKGAVSWSMGEALKWLFDEYRGEGEVGIGNAYQRHVWVHACINQIARNIAQVPLKVYRAGGDESQELKSHELLTLLAKPNQIMDLSQLMEATEIYKQIRGAAFWYLNSDGGKRLLEIGILQSENMRPRMSGNRIIGWSYQNGNASLQLGPEEICLFKYINPDNLVEGLSPLNVALSSIQGDDYAKRFNKSILKNGAFPGSVLETEKELSQSAIDRLKAQFKATHEGPDKAGKLAVFEGGLKYRELKITPEELQYVEQRKMSKEEIHAIYGVPLAITGDTSSFNRANMNDIKKEFWTKKLIPEMITLEGQINSQICARWYPDVRVKFDLNNIPELQDDLNTKLDMAVKLNQLGFTGTEINERLKLGFDNKPWRDIWYIPFNLVPVDDVLTGREPPGAQEQLMARSIKVLEGSARKIDEAVASKRFILWKALIHQIIPIETAYKRKVSRFIFETRQEALENFYNLYEKGFIYKKEGGNPLFNVGDGKLKIKKYSAPYILDAIKKGMKTGGEAMGLGTEFDLINQEAIDFFNNQQMYVATLVDTIDQKIVEILKEGAAQGLGTEEIAVNIRSAFDIAAGRSRLIARTEMMSAANGGRFLVYKDNIEKHEWVDSMDERVRDEHRLDGEVVRVGSEFSCGLKYPGDRTGSKSVAGNIVQCRCTIIPVIEED